MKREVWLRCPTCLREWREALYDEGAWYEASPESVASRPVCRCGQRPPMLIVGQPTQVGLFA